jgi:two-component system response regulator YesN
MYKMIIVDDEYLVRYGIEQTINWGDLGIEIVGDAKNGKEGLALALAKKPDIIISDVRMPLMDGLDFVKAIKDYALDTVIIMLSGYKDFEYAKETLENGAFSYLLKPIDNQEFIDVVLKGIEELNNRRIAQKTLSQIVQDNHMIAESILLKALNNPEAIPDWLEKLENYAINLPPQGRVIYINRLVKGKDSRKTTLAGALSQIMVQKDIASKIIEDDFNLIIISEDFSEESIVPQIKQALNAFDNLGYIYTVGISSVYRDLSNLPAIFQDAKRLSQSNLVLSTSTIICASRKLGFTKKLVCDVLHYIAENYAQNITIKTVSDALFVSESHLMHVLKEELGATFNECLTRQRINEAKRMLAQGNALIYEVAMKVGYNDAKYFSQVFKKSVGLTPIEYMQKKEQKQ